MRVVLVKAFEYHIGIETIRVLLVNVLKKRWWLWLNDTDIVDAAARNFYNFSVH